MLTKEQILNTLSAFIRQRPGLEFGNYGDLSSYRSELRQITKDRHQAFELLAAVSRASTITADDMIRASQGAFSGRLTIREDDKGRCVIDYCAGQYFPTEYRKAACAVLSSALWTYWREHCMPEPSGKLTKIIGIGPFQREHVTDNYGGMSAGDFLRATARRNFGRGIASRWFN